MRRRILIVNLYRVTEFERRFLEFLLFQKGLAAADMFGLGFFGTRAAAQNEQRCQQQSQQDGKRGSTSALNAFHFGLTPANMVVDPDGPTCLIRASAFLSIIRAGIAGDDDFEPDIFMISRIPA